MLERGPTLLSRQLDERAAELLRDYLEGLGLHVSLAVETESLRAGEDAGSGEGERLGPSASWVIDPHWASSKPTPGIEPGTPSLRVKCSTS